MPTVDIAGFEGFSTAKTPEFLPPNFIVNGENFLVRNKTIELRFATQELAYTASERISGNMYPKLTTTGDFDGFYYKGNGGEIVNVSSSLVRTLLATSGTTTRMDGVFIDKRFFIADGDSTNRIIDNSSTPLIRASGLPAIAPSSVVVSATGGSWAATGQYVYQITQVIKTATYEVESNGGSFGSTATVAVNTDKVTITRPSLDANATHWRVYRCPNAIVDLTFFVAEIVAGTSTYVDTGTATSSQLPIPSSNTRLTTPIKSIAFYKNRLWAATDSNTVVFSELNLPEYFPAENVFPLPVQSGGVQRLIAIDGGLVIICKNNIYALVGNNIVNFRLEGPLLNQGTFSTWSCCRGITPNTIYFQNTNGIWEYTIGSEPLQISAIFHNNFFSLRNNEWLMFCDTYNGWIWIRNPTETSRCLIYDPIIKRVIGLFNMASFVDSGCPSNNGFALAIRDGSISDIRLYNQTGSGGTDEPSYDFRIVWGSMVDDKLMKKLFRYAAITFWSAWPTVTIKAQTETDASPVTLKTVAPNDSRELVPINRGTRLLNLEVSGSNDGQTIKIINSLMIEYEPIGFF